MFFSLLPTEQDQIHKHWSKSLWLTHYSIKSVTAPSLSRITYHSQEYLSPFTEDSPEEQL